MQTIKKIIILIVITAIIITMAISFFYVKPTDSITFKFSEKFSNYPSILIDNEPVYINDNIIEPFSLTTLRPIQISVSNKKKKIRLKNLSKNHFIEVNIIYKDKTINYKMPTLPAQFPQISVDNHNNIKGYVLTSFYGVQTENTAYTTLLDMNGNILFYMGNTHLKLGAFLLKKFILPNGKVRYASNIQHETSEFVREGVYRITDSKFNVIDNISLLETKKHKKIPANEHDIIMLEDNHYIIFGNYPEIIMSENGKNTEIIHTIIQEIKNGKVLLDWDSKEYPELINANYDYKHQSVDYIHINSIDIDPKDNNLIISSAAGFNILKINRKTGDIMWILGGELNQFNEIEKFSFIKQHHAQISKNGDLIFIDNHYSWLPEFNNINNKAQILIFKLDEINKKIISKKSIPLNIYITNTGSIQELDDDKLFLGCGDNKDDCTAKIIDKEGNVYWRMFPLKLPYNSYRAYYYETLN